MSSDATPHSLCGGDVVKKKRELKCEILKKIQACCDLVHPYKHIHVANIQLTAFCANLYICVFCILPHMAFSCRF